MRSLKKSFYYVLKYTGIFRIARFYTRRGLRILCYHGISTTDTHAWRPIVFIRAETLRRRLELLAMGGYRVIDLDDAVDQLQTDRLAPNSVVLTFDDGFALTASHAVPLLVEYGVPATIYVTSYYCLKGTPVFRLAVQYMAWRNSDVQLDASALGIPEDYYSNSGLASDVQEPTLRQIVDYGESALDELGRVALSKRMALQLSFDYSRLVDSKELTIMSVSQVRSCINQGVDIQLHTRRHRFPVEEETASLEISQNREDLAGAVEKDLVHFCYPSGRWHPNHLQWLKDLGIRSATTTDVGLNYHGENPLTLKRFLDSEDYSAIEFEAELAGVAEALRSARRCLLAAVKSARRSERKSRRSNPEML